MKKKPAIAGFFLVVVRKKLATDVKIMLNKC